MQCTRSTVAFEPNEGAPIVKRPYSSYAQFHSSHCSYKLPVYVLTRDLLDQFFGLSHRIRSLFARELFTLMVDLMSVPTNMKIKQKIFDLKPMDSFGMW